jgi:hypothetical protein
MGIAALLFLSAAASFAQPIGAGVKIGAPLSDVFTFTGAGFSSEKPVLTAGPFVEVRLPARLAIEFDALYEGLRFHYDGRPAIEIVNVSARSWQFPLLLKYRFGSRRAYPFLSGGVAAFYIGSVGGAAQSLPDNVRSVLQRVGSTFVNGGGVVGGGIEVRLGPLRVAPELRFTRWAIRQSAEISGVSLATEQSRVHLFVGFSF